MNSGTKFWNVGQQPAPHTHTLHKGNYLRLCHFWTQEQMLKSRKVLSPTVRSMHFPINYLSQVNYHPCLRTPGLLLNEIKTWEIYLVTGRRALGFDGQTVTTGDKNWRQTFMRRVIYLRGTLAARNGGREQGWIILFYLPINKWKCVRPSRQWVRISFGTF